MAEPTEQIEDSILHDVKQLIGQEWDDPTFDLDIMTHINSVFLDLQQIGVGPEEGYSISSADDKWEVLLKGDKNLNAVKTYIYGKVRLVFDPPSTGPLLNSLQAQLDKIEWRLMVQTDPPLQNSRLGVIND